MEREAMPKKKVCRNQRSWAWPSVIPLCLERSKFKQENFNVGARGLLYSTFSSIYNSEVQCMRIWFGWYLIYIKPQNYLRSFRKVTYTCVKARSIRSQSLDLETRHVYFKTALHVILFWNWIKNQQPRSITQFFCKLEDRVLTALVG